MSKVDNKSKSYVNKWRVSLAVIVLLASLFAGGVEQFHWGSHEDALVMVNHQPVTRAQLTQVLNRTQSSTQREISNQQQQQLLEMLIDQELMLQHIEGQESLRLEPRLRKALVHQVIDDVVRQYLAKPVSDAELHAFYQEHKAVFKRPGSAAVTVLRFDTLVEAETISETMQRTSYEQVMARHGEYRLSHIPRSLMPASGLRRYLGPSLTHEAMSLLEGQISKPQITDTGVYVFYAHRVKAAYQPVFAEVKEDVRAEYYRRGRDVALGELLAQLRAQADIRIHDALDDVMKPRGGGV